MPSEKQNSTIKAVNDDVMWHHVSCGFEDREICSDRQRREVAALLIFSFWEPCESVSAELCSLTKEHDDVSAAYAKR